MGGDVLHADDPGHIAGHLHRHVGELERHGKGIIEDQDPGVADRRPVRPQRPTGMDAGDVWFALFTSSMRCSSMHGSLPEK